VETIKQPLLKYFQSYVFWRKIRAANEAVLKREQDLYSLFCSYIY